VSSSLAATTRPCRAGAPPQRRKGKGKKKTAAHCRDSVLLRCEGVGSTKKRRKETVPPLPSPCATINVDAG